MAKGIRIRHHTDKNCVRLVPLLWQPLIQRPAPGRPPRLCNLCQVQHPFKTMHLWIEPDGTVMVAEGIWKTLQKIGAEHGMEVADGFTYESETKTPPPLRIGKNGDRTVVDNENRKQHIYKVPKLKEATGGSIMV